MYLQHFEIEFYVVLKIISNSDKYFLIALSLFIILVSEE